ncbi:CarD family transcriptional regulator [Clostridium tertium]|uniref:CarD-like/TRCF domain protein n=1 Tax=Clostridium tertium TaxID=1559 RepID=A0A6N2YPN0_9CLOT
MFKKGDLILYSSHGICKIDDICEKTFSYKKRNYYILHPMGDKKLSISVPVDNENASMLELLTQEEAKEILESFKYDGCDWIALDKERGEVYSEVVKRGNRKEIAKIANTLIKEKDKLEANGKKFHEKDKKLLSNIENSLFSELAFLLNVSLEDIEAKINTYLKN